MTAAQKAAKANFKKAIEYRKKTGVSLKEAFAHVYGKKVGAAPKKKATKKTAPKKAAKKVVKKAAKKKHTKYGVVKKHVRRVSGNISGYANKYIFNVYSRDTYGDIITKSQKKVSISASNQQNAKDKLSKKYPNSKYFSELFSSETITKKVGAAPKKAAKKFVKKAAPKRSVSLHKDTKSHNVNIRVVSGVSKSSYALYNNVTSEIDKAKKYIINAENNIIRLKSFGNSPTAKKSIKMLKEYIKEQKTHITQLKKHI